MIRTAGGVRSLGWALLGETPPWLAAVGGALCVAGVELARSRSDL